MENNSNMEICIDFDGTCVTHDFPRVGKDIGAVPVLKKLVASGHKLILFTMRSDKEKGAVDIDSKELQETSFDTNVLKDACNWFEKNNIPLFGVNTNPRQKNWTSSPKAYAQVYIDDAALGCPLKYDANISDRWFVDWDQVEKILTANSIIR